MSRANRMFTWAGLGLLILAAGNTMAVEPTKFTDVNGKAQGLNDFVGKGKWTIAMIWASDCHVCNHEAPAYEAFHKKHKDRDAVMLGISLDGPDGLKDARTFVTSHKLSFPNIVGEGEDVAVMFYDMTGVHFAGTPTFLIFDPKGELKVQQIGAVPVEMIEEYLAEQTKAATKKQ